MGAPGVVRFTSFEAFPLQADDMARALAAFPEAAAVAGPWAAAAEACVTPAQWGLEVGAVQPWAAAAVLLSVAVAAPRWVVVAGRSAGAAAASARTARAWRRN